MQSVSRAELVGSDVVDSLHRARRLEVAAAADPDDDDDDDDASSSSRHHEMTKTAVRPWLLHGCDR